MKNTYLKREIILCRNVPLKSPLNSSFLNLTVMGFESATPICLADKQISEFYREKNKINRLGKECFRAHF